MTTPQAIAFGILGVTLVMFVWGRWRYDVVAVAALLATVLTGLVPAGEAFNGFAHPAVVTVAAVLVISRGLQNAGLVDAMAQLIAPLRGRENLQLAAQCVLIAFLSSFMNNVGALALMMPVALRNAYREGYPPGKVLMPLAFGSLLGGLTTLIGTPPNLIVSSFRAEQAGGPFGIFDFSWVGLPVAVAGLIFLVVIGWRWIPLRGRGSEAAGAFEIADYITEAAIPEKSKAAGLLVYELEELADDDVTVAAIVRDEQRRLAPAGYIRLHAGDILVLRGDTESIKTTIDSAELKLVGDMEFKREDLKSEDIDVVEAIVKAGSRLIGSTPVSARLRTVHGLNLLAVSRRGEQISQRLGHAKFQTGDVLLLQGPRADMTDTMAALDLLPLAERQLGIGRPRRLALSGGIFAAAVALTVAGVLPVQIAFVAAAALLVITNVVRPTEVYTSIDWPVIVLLAALFPVGGALEATGGAGLIADWILKLTEGLSPVVVLAILLVGTMCISDVINNNATALLMAPIALILANRLGVSADPFLMAVALGASCAFLTPIGHQSNTLVMEPGGYRFGDYWRVGLPLEVIIAVVAIPFILLFWPL